MKSIFFIFCSILLVTMVSCHNGRHIPELKRPDITIEDTIRSFTSFDKAELIQMDSLLKSAEERARKSDFMSEIKETIYLLVENKVAFTVEINGMDVNVHRGKLEDSSPTLFIPFTQDIATNVNDVLEDYKLDPAERFNVSYVVYMPCLQRMYSMPYLFETGMFKNRLDDYLQFVVKNPEGYTYHGKEVDISATVVNVDGMFLILPGLVGDPDLRLELTLDQAIQLYTYIAYDAAKQQSLGEKLKLSEKYSKLVEECVVYERAWH